MVSSAPEQPAAESHTGAAPRKRSRERFWNLPNTVTMVRTAAVPVLLLLPFYPGPRGSQVVAWCFVVAAVTDLLDGWLARRGQMVTRVGKLLDPLVDKLIVAAALVVMVSMDRIPFWAIWMVVVIIGRELAVTGLRSIASADGTIMAAVPAGKIKAFVQNCAIACLLFHYPTFGLPAHEIGLVLLCFATALTLFSGYVYFASYFGDRGQADPAAGEPDP